MANFTKDEWFLQTDDKFVDGASITSETRNGMQIICEVRSAYFDNSPMNPFEQEQKANAHLIKTSPKMYNLLHKIMLEYCNDSVLYNEIDELLEEARGDC